MSFYDQIQAFEWAEIGKVIGERTGDDVERVLGTRPMNLDSLISLLSPAAEPYLEQMAREAHRLTQQRFGKVIGLFAPLYLSNECVNGCVYCGFNARNPVDRLTLTVDQVMAEARHIRDMGFRHLLLVSGEAPHIVSMDYLKAVADRLGKWFPSLSIEIYPLDTSSYAELIEHGVDGLIVYQETYDKDLYGQVHPRGKKSDYRWRIETPDRGGTAGFRRLGLGSLLGLNDWRTEGFFLGLHARYLQKTYWKSHISISFPRLRPAAGGFQPRFPVSDRNLVQLLTALRLFLPDAGFTLSTREPATLRNHLIPLGITLMSAGSHTEPGGYTNITDAEAQFEIADSRSPEEVAGVLRQMGYEPVWKDWDAAFSTQLKLLGEPASERTLRAVNRKTIQWKSS